MAIIFWAMPSTLSGPSLRQGEDFLGLSQATRDLLAVRVLTIGFSTEL